MVSTDRPAKPIEIDFKNMSFCAAATHITGRGVLGLGIGYLCGFIVTKLFHGAVPQYTAIITIQTSAQIALCALATIIGKKCDMKQYKIHLICAALIFAVYMPVATTCVSLGVTGIPFYFMIFNSSHGVLSQLDLAKKEYDKAKTPSQEAVV